MQNGYVGDVGDFGKYGLLRYLMRTSGYRRLGIVWYLAPPENNGDGGHLSYLCKPRDYRHCDPVLFDGLNALVKADRRSVAAVKASGILGSDTTFCERLTCSEVDPGRGPAAIAARRFYRDQWMVEAQSVVDGCDLVFLDPDNGIGGRSFRAYGKKGHKHASWDEVRQFAGDGTRTMVIYHHTGRSASAAEQARRLVAGYQAMVPNGQRVMALGFRRGTHRIFLIAPATDREKTVHAQVTAFLKLWQEHYVWLAE